MLVVEGGWGGGQIVSCMFADGGKPAAQGLPPPPPSRAPGQDSRRQSWKRGGVVRVGSSPEVHVRAGWGHPRKASEGGAGTCGCPTCECRAGRAGMCVGRVLPPDLHGKAGRGNVAAPKKRGAGWGRVGGAETGGDVWVANSPPRTGRLGGWSGRAEAVAVIPKRTPVERPRGSYRDASSCKRNIVRAVVDRGAWCVRAASGEEGRGSWIGRRPGGAAPRSLATRAARARTRRLPPAHLSSLPALLRAARARTRRLPPAHISSLPAPLRAARPHTSTPHQRRRASSPPPPRGGLAAARNHTLALRSWTN